jgi:Fic family protein
MYFVYKQKNCPVLIWDNETILNPLASVRYLQGRVIGKIESLAPELRKEAVFETFIVDVCKAAEMAKVSVSEENVHLLVAKKFGLISKNSLSENKSIDGIIDVMLDSMQNYNIPLTAERLFFWHKLLFGNEQQEKTGKNENWLSKIVNIKQSVYQNIKIGREHHFKSTSNKEMSHFIDWFNNEKSLDSVMKAAVAHLWFTTIRPFDDGNMRIASALTNMLLSISDNTPQRLYSMLAQIRAEQKQYYSVLEKTKNENFDITNWMLWFFDCMKKALNATDTTLHGVLKKAEFWKTHNKILFNNRQRLVINKLLNGIDGKLQSSKWAKIAKCSSDTALRDIKDLVEKGILMKKTQGGRSTNYELTY